MHPGGNWLLHGRGRVHYVREYPGPFSVKCVLRGSVEWRVGGSRLRVDESSMLILHEGEPYSLEIESAVPVETLCPFFAPGFVESVLSPVDGSYAPLRFVSRLQPFRLGARLDALRSAEGVAREEQFVLLARDVAALHREGRAQMERLAAVRAGTREELFRRVCRGREYLHAHASEAVTLLDMAREACLSEFHFHRAFRAAFGQTPSSYLRELRLSRAAAMLRNRGVTEVAAEVGYGSLPSFSREFRHRYGLAPSEIRKLG